MMRITLFFFICISVLFVDPNMVFGQSDTLYKDVIILQNGYAFKCKILNVDPFGVTVNTKQQDSSFYPHDIIRIVKQAEKTKLPKPDKTSSLTQVWNGSVQVGFGSGGQSDQLFSSLILDAGLKLKLFKNSSLHHIRTNLAVINFKGFSNISTLNWTGGYQLKLMDKVVSPYIFGDIGYGFGLNLDNESDQGDPKSKGGNTYSFGLGLLFRSGYVKSWDVSMGYLSQKTKKDYSFPWQSNTVYQDFNRIYCKIGVNF